MKKYSKRINIWIDEDFENEISFLKNCIEFRITEKDGKVSISDVIRYAVKEYAEICGNVKQELNKKS